MTSGGQCVMTPGTALMLLWSASNWGTLEVSTMFKYECEHTCLSTSSTVPQGRRHV